VITHSVVHDDVTIGPGARVHDSVVGPGAVIGADAEVADRSIVGADAVVEPGGCLVRARRPATPTPATSP
jgi:carbonic anhydrase/acetyltransferase-like protein (isoleucine patch superfamily)